MIKKYKKIIFLTILVLLILGIFVNNTFAVDTGFYKPTPTINPQGKFVKGAGVVISWIKYTGVATTVIAIALMGLVFMFSSLEEKAEYKKKMIPYLIGCLIISSVSLFIGFIRNIVTI